MEVGSLANGERGSERKNGDVLKNPLQTNSCLIFLGRFVKLYPFPSLKKMVLEVLELHLVVQRPSCLVHFAAL